MPTFTDPFPGMAPGKHLSTSERARMFLPEKISPQVQAGMQVATKAALGALGGK
jgi:hypothetical protein